MNDRNRRSAAEVMANAARVVKAAVNIVRAAIAGGLHGAAAAAAKELLPTIIKFAVGVLIAIIVIPMFVISAMPNMFFGYETSEKDSQITMREQALSIGGAYLSLEDFEKTQMDAIVTGLAAEYQNRGIDVDEIHVDSKFDEEDLCWYIAINSVAHKQDLGEMRPEEIQALLIRSLRHTASLKTQRGTTTLKITFLPLDPDALMRDLDFDEDARTWAGAIYETIYESDALNKYKDKFEAYKPSYAGDTGYTGPAESSPGGSGGGGGAESGGSADNTIDISGFTNPRTKNNHDLAAYAIQAWEHGWGYVWGTFGTVLTESMLQYKLEQYPDIGASEAFIREHWLGRRTTDCVGLLKGYGWLNPDTLTIDYNTNGMPDYTADQMYAAAKENGTEYGGMDTMPDIVGLGLWKQGHWGVYVGNGYAIEAMGTQYGVVRTKVEGRGWQGWCKIPYIQYDD